jgi:IS5 family transposase
VAQRLIGQEQFGFAGRELAASSLDALVSLIDWSQVAVLLDPLYPAAKGEPACCRWRCSRPYFCRSGTTCPT